MIKIIILLTFRKIINRGKYQNVETMGKQGEQATALLGNANVWVYLPSRFPMLGFCLVCDSCTVCEGWIMVPKYPHPSPRNCVCVRLHSKGNWSCRWKEGNSWPSNKSIILEGHVGEPDMVTMVLQSDRRRTEDGSESSVRFWRRGPHAKECRCPREQRFSVGVPRHTGVPQELLLPI